VSWKRFFLFQAHGALLAGHPDTQKTQVILAKVVWWKGMLEDVTTWVRRCRGCAATAIPVKPPQVASGASRYGPWEDVQIVLVGPISPPSREGFTYICTYVCTFLRHPLIGGLTDKRKGNVIRMIGPHTTEQEDPVRNLMGQRA
jgi:hypothetical protein